MVPAGQTFPQAPQLLGSVWVEAQVPFGQAVWPGPHWHTPLTQDWPAPQVLKHAPQCCGFEPTATQTLPQSAWPEGHSHLPETQLVPSGHTWPQPPQCSGSESTFTQTPLQSC